eukprot:CAMPEP_0194411622 /NCGR_PEP_ID=MMETSP0176-20130528/9838_1 /TAXON_ID=216777 /ORGANISM="Proboscia alata, Strain PI-D3" /LENGTH=540 /DNA_ID=CAMNT_0039213731 /DNA_START=51 /DNA_END=1673 /DNA_ORIENTATION=-
MRKSIVCDYLVVGAGAASMAFIDTLLTELPSAKIMLVDRKSIPGGHWVDAYGYVHLHQPSIVYGVGSKQLEGNWAKLLFLNWTLPWKHRANKDEILTYFGDFVKDKVSNGQLEYYPNCEYDFAQSPVGNEAHVVTSLSGESYEVTIGTKLVNGVLGECKVPSQCPVQFPVEDGIVLMTPNQLFDSHVAQSANSTSDGRYRGCGSGSDVTTTGKHYVVLGCGKTAMDAVVFLQTVMNIHPTNISWVIPNDVWMLARNKGDPSSLGNALIDNEGDYPKSVLELEKQGLFVRLDPTIAPTKFRFPIIGPEELTKMRLVTNRIRRGRVTGISHSSGKAVMEFGEQEHWTSPVSNDDTVFIHCTSPGPFNGKTHGSHMFGSDREMNLLLLFAPPISASMSCLAYIEAARKNGTLDIDFCQKLSDACEPSGSRGRDCGTNSLLQALFKVMPLDDSWNDVTTLSMVSYQSILNVAIFLAVANRDPLVGLQWMKGNRLSLLSVPGSKCKLYETMSVMAIIGISKLGLPKDLIGMIELLRDRLKPLEGL